MASSKPDFRWAAKIRTSIAFCLVGTMAGAGLYFGNLAYVRAGNEAASPLGGLSLTAYCSTLGTQGAQGYTVAGTDCVHPVNLDAACDFQYQATGLKAEFTSSYPDSTICYNPANHVTHAAGISSMIDYCATLTIAAHVTATSANPGYKDTWVCQVAINMSLACDVENNQTDLAARQVNGTWMCYEG
jgi:hypothetical protein